MPTLNAVVEIQKFARKGEKSGWTYIGLSAEQAGVIKPGCHTSFRVKGKLDAVAVSGLSLLPMGGGTFILALKSDLRKVLGKSVGAQLHIRLHEDKTPLAFPPALLECLQDEPEAAAQWESLTPGHRAYFGKWIEGAKGEDTRTRRIALTLDAMSKGWGYPQMIRAEAARRKDFDRP